MSVVMGGAHISQTLRLMLDKIYQQLEMLPGEQARVAQMELVDVWSTIGMMNIHWSEMATLLVQQRDQALSELSAIISAVEDVDYHHPVVGVAIGEIYERQMEEHNGNFWTSLPYDVAHTLGRKWTHSDAQALVDLIIDHDDLDDEEWAEEHGWTLEAVKIARARLLKAVRGLKEGVQNDDDPAVWDQCPPDGVVRAGAQSGRSTE
jgi:hypothetical protein